MILVVYNKFLKYNNNNKLVKLFKEIFVKITKIKLFILIQSYIILNIIKDFEKNNII